MIVFICWEVSFKEGKAEAIASGDSAHEVRVLDIDAISSIKHLILESILKAHPNSPPWKVILRSITRLDD